MPFSARTRELLDRLAIPPELVVARGLQEYAEATVLEVAELGQDGRHHLLAPPAAQAWRMLKQAAAADGVTLAIVSAFRSVDRQVAIIERKRAAGQSLAEILAVSAPPGFSEHHTGCAIDIGTPGSAPLELEFETTEAFGWLSEQARRFGFVLSYPPDNACGYQYEPWHWCYRDGL